MTEPPEIRGGTKNTEHRTLTLNPNASPDQPLSAVGARGKTVTVKINRRGGSCFHDDVHRARRIVECALPLILLPDF